MKCFGHHVVWRAHVVSRTYTDAGRISSLCLGSGPLLYAVSFGSKRLCSTCAEELCSLTVEYPHKLLKILEGMRCHFSFFIYLFSHFLAWVRTCGCLFFPVTYDPALYLSLSLFWFPQRSTRTHVVPQLPPRLFPFRNTICSRLSSCISGFIFRIVYL